MSMYKTIFVTEDQDFTGENVISLNGEVYMFGESAFAKLEEAVAKATDGNGIVLKVASGKYESFYVVSNGAMGAESALEEIFAVNFGGGTTATDVNINPSNLAVEQQAEVLAGLNANANPGTVYVAADENINANSTIYVSNGVANFTEMGSEAVVSGSNINDIITLITGKNPDVQIEVSNDSENEVVSEAKTIFVNAEYTDDQIDEAHFNSFEDALAAACQDASIGRIEVESNISEQAKNVEDYYYISQDLVIGSKAGEKYTVNLGVAILNQAGNSITFEENVIVSGLDVVANGFATSGENMYINGEMNALSLKQWTSNGEILVSETGKVALGYGDGQFDMAYGNGSVTVNGTGDWSEAQFKAGYSGTRGNGNTLNLNDTYFEAGAWFNVAGSNGTINMDNSKLTVSGGDAAGTLTVSSSGNVINVENGSLLDVATVTLGADNTINVEGSDVKVSTLTNNGTFTVSGESTLNITTMTGSNTIDLLDGAIVKDSTVGGNAFVAGNVTFRGDNSFNMITDFGNLTDYYGTTAPMQWTVEEGASLTLTNKERYGLGYGDKVTVNGTISAGGATAARATLNDDNAENDVKSSLFMHGLVAQESKGWNENSSLTINNAYVTIGSNNSFGNKPGNYGGTYTFSINNSVVDSSRITFYEALSQSNFTFKDSDVNVGTFMTRDSDSVFTLDNTKLVSTTATNGTDEGNFNAGTLNINNGSDITYTAELKNEGGTINVTDSAFTAGTVTNNGTFIISGDSSVKINELLGTKALRTADGATLLDSSYIKGINGTPTLRALGDLEIAGDFTLGNDGNTNAFFKRDSNDVAADLTIGNTLTVNGQFNWYNGNISGGTINATYVQLYENNVQSNINAEVGLYLYSGTVIDGVSVTHNHSAGDNCVWVSGDVTLKNGAALVSNQDSLHFGNADSSISAIDSSIKAAGFGGSYVNISLTVTADKLGTLGKDAYYIIDQTGTGAALNVGVNYNGTTYMAGQSFTINDIIYTVTNGDGNDIAIKANAKVVTLDSTATENGFTVFNKADTFFAEHASYETRMQGAPEEIKVVGTNTLESTASKYYVYTDSDLSITGGTLDVSSAGRFYFMDNVAAKGTAAADADFSNVATVTIEEGATLKGYINLGQAIDNHENPAKADVDANGNVTRDGGAMNMIVKGTLDHKNIYVNSGSTLTVTETGKVTNYKNGGDNHIRANAKVVVNGTGKDSDVQFKTNWWSIRGGEMEFNNTNAETGTLRLNADNDNAVVIGDTEATLKVNNSKLTAYSIEVNNADSSFSAIDSDVAVKDLLQNAGSMDIANSTVSANNIKNSGILNVTGNSTVKVDKFTSTSGKAVTFGGAEDRSELTIGSVSGNGAAINVDRLNIYKSDVTLTDNVTVGAPTGAGETYGLHKIQDSTIDLNGKSMNYKGFVVIDSYEGVSQLGSNQGVTIKNGEFNVTDSAHLCFQGYDHVIAENATVNFVGSAGSSMVNVYGSLTVNGKLHATHDESTQHGYDNVGTTDGNPNSGFPKEKYPQSVLTVSGANAEYIIENGHMFRVIHETDSTGAGTMNIVNGATFSFTGADGRSDVGLFFNSNIVNVDAQSSFTVGNYIGYDETGKVKGSFNSSKAGEMVVLGDVTIYNSLKTDSIVINKGANLYAGSITVSNLTLAIGSSLTLGNGNSSIAADYITVTGQLIPESAEFTLVASGWTDALSGKEVRFDANGNGTIEDNEIFTVQNSVDSLSGLNFVSQNGNLYVKDFGAATSGVFIGNIGDAQNGEKIVIDNVTYTVGVDAFANAADAASSANVNNDTITAVVLGAGDHVDEVKESFANVNYIAIQKEAQVIDNDNSVAEFSGSLTIQNDGHLDTHIKAEEEIKITNTSVNTLLGGYEAADGITIENLGGKIGDNGEDATTFTTSYMEVKNGDGENIKVDADVLELTDTNTFGINSDSGILTNNGAVLLNGSANMSIDGDITDSNVTIDADITEHTGTLTLNGNQTFNGDISANKIEVVAGKEVTLNGYGVDFNELAVAGTLNTDFTKMTSATDGGAVTGNGNLNSTHEGAWVVNETVIRDFSDFNGTVSMENADASIVMGKGTDSYFSNDATVEVNGAQSAVLAKDGVNTAIDFVGNGSLNVGDYDNGFVDGSAGFSQTLSGDNSSFTGTVNVSEGATLKVENALGATAINLNYNDNVDATGADDATSLVLNKDGLDVKATVTGDANDIIAVKENATLSKTGALNNFAGTVDVANGKTVSLNAENNTAAEFVGGETATIDVNANTTLTAAGALNDFDGTVDIGTKKLILDGTNTTDAIFKSESTSARLELNADQTFNADGALNQLENQILLNSNDLTLNGENTFSSIIKGNTDANLNLNADLTLDRSKGMALMEYKGTVNVNDNTLTVTKTENTQAKFTGTTDATIDWYAGIMASNGALNEFYGNITVGNELTLKGTNDTAATFSTNKTININANNTFSTAGAINDVTGTIKLWGNTLTLKGENTTSATLTSYAAGILDADANQTFTGDVSAFTGTYDIASDKTVTMSATSTIADTINAQGGTLALENTAVKDITVNGGSGLTNLEFGGNNLTLGSGDFTNVTGTGDIHFGTDKNFGTIEAKDIFVAGDNITIEDALQAVVNLTISGNSDDTADVTFNGGTDKWDDTIKVVIASDFTGAYKLVKSEAGYTITKINLSIGTESADINIGDAAQIGGYTYRLINDGNTLVLDKMSLYSNFVVIDADWTGAPYNQVSDNGTIRNIGYDAAGSLDTAVEYIKGYDKGTGWIENGNTVEVAGGAKIELTAGTYKLSADNYLMTAANEVTNLTVSARDGETAAFSGVIRGADGSTATTLTINNVRILGNLFAGGNLVINNAETTKSTASFIVGGVDKNGADVLGSSVTLNGGIFAGRNIIGGSYGKDITVTGNTGVVIDNNSGVELTVNGDIYGASYGVGGTITQNGNAYVTINADEALNLRGSICVSGYNTTVNGDSIVTFSGNGANLYFTGSVNAAQSTYNEIAIFDDFKGEFNGYFNGFDSVTISSASSLILNRRQTLTEDTSLVFNVDKSSKSSAMYIVRDANRWEFAKNITINVDEANITAGSYTIVDNYLGGYEGFEFTFEGSTYTLGSSVTVGDKQFTVTENGDALVMQVANVYSGDVTGNVSGNVALDNANISGNVKGDNTGVLNMSISGTNNTITGNVNAGKWGSAASSSVTIQDGANVNITGEMELNYGVNSVAIGKSASVTVGGGDGLAGAAMNGSTLVIEKGASVTTPKVNNFNITMDVDSVLNATNAGSINYNIDVVGVTDLVLNGAVAGAKSVFSNFNALDKYTKKIDGVDAATQLAGADTPDNPHDDVWSDLGEVKQIAGASTTNTDDDVWASLNKIDNDLVVAWGRTEAEVGSALDAFKADNTLTLGDAVVGNATTLGDADASNDFEKKNNGTLA